MDSDPCNMSVAFKSWKSEVICSGKSVKFQAREKLDPVASQKHTQPGVVAMPAIAATQNTKAGRSQIRA